MKYRLPTLPTVAGVSAALTALMATLSPGATAHTTTGRPGQVGNGTGATAASVTASFRGPGRLPPVGEGSQARQLLLINGDHVLVTGTAKGAGPGLMVPASRGGLAASMMALTVGGASYEIPAVAQPYLAHGLDPRLFEVTSLLATETRGRLPVRINYRERIPRLPGIRITHSSGGTAQGYLTAASAKAFGAALDRQYGADYARGSYGADGMFAGGTTINLAGPVSPARPARKPTASGTKYTLTIKATNLAGKPGTGGVFLQSADNTQLIPFNETGHVFRNGIATYSLTPGHYFAVGGLGGLKSGPPSRFVVLPQIDLASNQTVTMRETAASSKVTMVTPRPATVLSTDLYLKRTGTYGPPILLQLLRYGTHVWISPTHTEPTVGTLQAAANQHLESPPGHGVPYEYTLSYTDPPGTIPVQHYVALAKDLATVHDRFYQAVKSAGAWAFNGTFPRTSLFGFIAPIPTPLSLPGQLTEYAGGTGTKTMEWHGQYLPVSGTPWLWEATRPLRPGEQSTDNWSAYPLHPAPNVLLDPKPDPFGPIQPSAVRAGNTLSLDINPFDDNQPGHAIGVLWPTNIATVAGRYQIDQKGTKIAGGDATKQIGLNGQFYTHTVLSPKPSTVRLSLTLTRAGEDFPLSTATSTVWTWHSAPMAGAKLPSGWSCAPLTRNRNCAVQPMMTLYYHVARLALNGSAPAGKQTLGISVSHLQLAQSTKITSVRAWVSFDNGETWRAASVTHTGGSRYHASFTAANDALVTLRTSATDAAGGAISETISRAYRVAP